MLSLGKASRKTAVSSGTATRWHNTEKETIQVQVLGDVNFHVCKCRIDKDEKQDVAADEHSLPVPAWTPITLVLNPGESLSFLAYSGSSNGAVWVSRVH